jgi:hypothetical protein
MPGMTDTPTAFSVPYARNAQINARICNGIRNVFTNSADNEINR